MIVAVLLISLIGVVVGKRDGAPEAACETMEPSTEDDAHGSVNGADGQENPYKIELSATDYKKDTDITVTLKGDDTNMIKGFMLYASIDGSKIPLGEFIGIEDADVDKKTITCTNDKAVVTHKDGQVDKPTVEVTWKPPTESDKDIYLMATVAKEKATWFKDVKSVPFKYAVEENPSPSPDAPAETTPEDNKDEKDHGSAVGYSIGVMLMAAVLGFLFR